MFFFSLYILVSSDKNIPLITSTTNQVIAYFQHLRKFLPACLPSPIQPSPPLPDPSRRVILLPTGCTHSVVELHVNGSRLMQTFVSLFFTKEIAYDIKEKERFLFAIKNCYKELYIYHDVHPFGVLN